MTITKQERLAYTDRAAAIVKQLSLEEKVYLMSGRVSLEDLLEDISNGHPYNWYPYPAGGNKRLSVPEMTFVDGPRGVVSGNSTCFPVSMARGATFDKDLEERIGKAIGKEIRAHGGNLFGGVCINLPRHPGWGRSQEVYGEDSFHLGAMGASLVKGVQNENVIACVKHYAFNSMENARFQVSVETDERTEREVYLAHFKDCIDAGAASVMSAYNLYQGVHCGHSDYLLNKVLKEEWDFDGFVISDFIWGVKDTVEAANGGMDIEMCHTKFFGEKLVAAVKNGEVSEESINQSALRIIRTLLAFTEADEKSYSQAVIGCPEHVALAMEAAEKAMTLMQNDHHVLPFSKETSKRIAVIGKLGNQENIGDHGSSRVFPDYIVTPLEGIKKAVPHAEIMFNDGSDVEVAKKLAKDADAVIFVVGYNYDDEGEFIDNPDAEIDPLGGGEAGFGAGGDRKMSLGLHKDESELIQSVGPCNANSVVVLIGGSTIMIEEWKEDVSAILMAYYPGMEGGTALAKTLFGDVNPSGKLPFVVPQNEKDLPETDWEATKIKYDYYHGYTKLDKEGKEPTLPFGFGLSYTTFDVTNSDFKVTEDVMIASSEVENIGDRAGAEVIQLYVGYSESKIDRPVKVLRGFERVTLEPGEKQTVQVTCPIEKLKWYNPQTKTWELEDILYDVYIGTSSGNQDLKHAKIKITH